jgi:ketosteroid isomerase-like protein
MTEDELSVLAANRAFYAAYERGDLDAMSDLWEHSPRASCVHPGCTVLRGWAAVGASWMALFQGRHRQQFLVTEEHVEVVGDAAWVTADENILLPDGAVAVSALNLFVRDGAAWKMVGHHGTGVAPTELPA